MLTMYFSYSFNWYNALNKDYAEFIDMKSFMEQELEKAKVNGDKVRKTRSLP